MAEGGILDVTVVATVPAGTKGANGQVPPIASKQVMVSFATDDPSIDKSLGEDADDGELAALGATNGAYTWTKIPRTEKASEQTYTFQVEVRRDVDAEDEKFQVEVKIDGAAMKSKVVMIDDAQEQDYALSLPATAKGAITEGAPAATALTLKADPRRTVDIPVTLTLNPNDPTKYVLGDATGDFGTAAFTSSIQAKMDDNREDDTITVTAFTEKAGELTSLEITVTDSNALPMVKATIVDDKGMARSPQPESVVEGETVKVMLTVVDKDGKSMKAVEKLSVSLMPSGTADAQDYQLSTHPIEIASGKESSAPVDLMVTGGDQDFEAETLMFDATVSGEAKNGTGTKSVENILSLMIEDATKKPIEPKSQGEAYPVITGAMGAAGGSDGLNPGESFMLMADDLFTVAEGYTAGLSVKVEGAAATAVASGDSATVTAAAAGKAKVTITGTATMDSSSFVPEQVATNVASITFEVTVVDKDLVVMLEMPSGVMEGNIVEGQSYDIVAKANRAVTEDTEVMIMRDRAASDAGDDDFTVTSAMIKAGADMATAELMVTEDNMPDGGTNDNMGESLVLYGMVGTMETNSLTFTIWDMAVPALPLFGQLLLALFLMLGGARLYRRRQG